MIRKDTCATSIVKFISLSLSLSLSLLLSFSFNTKENILFFASALACFKATALCKQYINLDLAMILFLSASHCIPLSTKLYLLASFYFRTPSF